MGFQLLSRVRSFAAVLPEGRGNAPRVREGSKGTAFPEHPQLTRYYKVSPTGITTGNPCGGPSGQWFFNSHFKDEQNRGPENLSAMPKDKSWSVC